MKKFFDPGPVLFSTGGAAPGLSQDTIQNFKNAVSLGTDVIRTNIVRTVDDKLVLASDAVFLNSEIRKSGISSFVLDDLRVRYRNPGVEPAGYGARDDIDGMFPELEQVLDSFPEQRFNLYFFQKNYGLMKRFLEIARGMNAADRILASSQSNFNVGIIRAEMPKMATSFPFTGMIGFYTLYKTGFIFLRKRFDADALLMPEMSGMSYFASSGLIHEARSRGIRVYVQAVETEEQARRLREAGADGFITNNIEAIRHGIQP
ncbi:MAG: hypothetical protein A2176_00930 [Spirochaetes bacterium RBG_13_51_14]|nr:MAG: hypothetical protein A2176_00930 [Spirochaetes bacterium RBG_13_51_14]